MKSILFGLLISCFAQAKTMTFEGQSQAERRIRFLWQNVSPILLSCYVDQEKCLPKEYRPLIMKLIQMAPARFEEKEIQPWQAQLKFVSEKEFQFESGENETHRIAMTNVNGTRTVYINTDQISQNGAPYDYDFYLGILVHEMIHWLGIADDAERKPDIIGVAVAQYFQKQSIVSQQNLVSLDIPMSILVFNARGPMNIPVIALEQEHQVLAHEFSTSDQIQTCIYGTEVILSQEINDLRWKIVKFLPAQKKIELAVTGSVTAECNSFFGSTTPQRRHTYFFYTVQITAASSFDENFLDQDHLGVKTTDSKIGLFDDPEAMTFVRDPDYMFKIIQKTSGQAQAGDTITYELELLGTGDISEFKVCTGWIWSESWQYAVGQPRGMNATTCEILPHQKARVTFRIPDQVVDVDLQLIGIGMASPTQKQMALINRPNLTPVKGNVSRGNVSMKVSYTGVTPLHELAGTKLTSSYKAGSDDLFHAVLEITGSQKNLVQDYDATMMFDYQGQLSGRSLTASMNFNLEYMKKKTEIQTSKGMTIDLTFFIAPQIFAVKLDRFSIITEQLEYVSLDYFGDHENYFFSPRLTEHN